MGCGSSKAADDDEFYGVCATTVFEADDYEAEAKAKNTPAVLEEVTALISAQNTKRCDSSALGTPARSLPVLTRVADALRPRYPSGQVNSYRSTNEVNMVIVYVPLCADRPPHRSRLRLQSQRPVRCSNEYSRRDLCIAGWLGFQIRVHGGCRPKHTWTLWKHMHIMRWEESTAEPKRAQCGCQLDPPLILTSSAARRQATPPDKTRACGPTDRNACT